MLFAYFLDFHFEKSIPFGLSDTYLWFDCYGLEERNLLRTTLLLVTDAYRLMHVRDIT